MRTFTLCLLVAVLTPLASAQALYHAGETGFVLGLGYTRSTGGTDINTYAVDGVATVTPSVDLSAGFASAGRDRSRAVPALGLGGTVYLLRGPDVWLGPTAGLSVAEVFTGRPVGVYGTGGVTAAGRWEAGPVGVVVRGEVTASTPFTDRTADDPFTTAGLGVGLQFTFDEGAFLAVEPTVGHSFFDNRNGLTVVGGTLRLGL
jgi:hypothetical protein